MNDEKEKEALQEDELYIGVLAHDMRSSLTAVVGYAETLDVQWDVLDEATKRKIVEAMLRNARNLQHFVEETLQLTHLESGQFQVDMQPFDIATVVQMAIEAQGADAPRIRLVIASDLPRALGDPQRQWQILTNLISNALKYSPSDLPIDVEIDSDEDRLRVRVSDRGVGIAETDLPRLFRKFERLGDISSQRGIGLGLYICKCMIEAQGGEIFVESSPGEGSTFSYTVLVS
jgi:signal transduction histidine kinase